MTITAAERAELEQSIADAKAELALATVELAAFKATMNELSIMDWRLLHDRCFRKDNAAKRLERAEAFAATVQVEPDPTPASPASATRPVRIAEEVADCLAA
jgi:hypothetical protein